MSQPKRENVERLHITVSKHCKEIADKILTPSGFFEPPKGTYSQLFSQLLQQYLETTFNAGIFDILEYFNSNPDASEDEAKQYFKEVADGTATTV